MSWKIHCLTVLVAALASHATWACTYVVNPEGTGDFPTVQAAINTADPGDVICLVDGTYTGSGNRDIDFLGKAVTVRSQSGDPSTCIVDCQASPVDQHRGFLFQGGEGPDSVLEGLTVMSGDRTGGFGGGIVCSGGSSPTLTDLILTGNHARFGGGLFCTGHAAPFIVGVTVQENFADTYGAGMYVTALAAPTLNDVTFRRNVASHPEWSSDGGGMYVDNAAPSMTAVAFEGNEADWGGGLYLKQGVYSFTGLTFESNTALRGAAVTCDDDTTLELFDSRISRNDAGKDAGGIYCWSGSTVHLTDVLLEENTAVEHGGGVVFRSSSPTFTNVQFHRNRADATGGAIWCNDAAPAFTNVEFSGNVSVRGGALSCYSSTPSLIQTTCFGNLANEGGALFGGNLTDYSLTNVTLLENSASSGKGAGIYLINSGAVVENGIISFSIAGDAVRCGSNATAELTCCDIFGNAGGDWAGCIAGQFGTNGNFTADPLFCGSQNPEEPYTLHEDSPCAPENNPRCGLVGAWPVGCGQTSSVPDPDGDDARREATWGRIKASYR